MVQFPTASGAEAGRWAPDGKGNGTHVAAGAGGGAAPASGDKILKIEITSVNVKRIDLKAYGIEKARCQVKVKVDNVEKWTSIQIGLDPTWEEVFEFPIVDPEATKCSCTFYMDEKDKQKQIGDEQFFILPLLKKEESVFKGLIVPGGRVDMFFTAYGFGKEQVVEDDSAFMDMMGGDDLGMDGFDSDEDDE